MNKIRHMTKKTRLILCAMTVLAVCVIGFGASHVNGESQVKTEQTEVTAVTLEQTLTAAGEIKAAKIQEVSFSTSSAFKGMCVEEGDSVTEGQHLVLYSNGTYTDAPATGVITSIDAPAVGEYASDDDIITLDCTDNMVLEVTIPEGEISKVTEGDDAQVTVNASPNETYEGTILSVKSMSASQLAALTSEEESTNAEGDSAAVSAGYTVRISLDNDGTLKEGMSAGCTITVSSRKSVTAVPIEAVMFTEDGEPYVNQVQGNDITQVPVTTGESDADYVEITDGVSVGDTIQIETGRQK